MPAYIRHSLGLALRLVDTTTGHSITDRGTRILWNGTLIHPQRRQDGWLIFFGFEEPEVTLDVTIPDFEPCTILVRKADLNPKLPVIEHHMIPSDGFMRRIPCHTLAGTTQGITAIDCVRANDSPCLIRGFDQRKKLMTIFNPHHLELARIHYALVNPDDFTYESFEIVSRISDTVFKLDRPLTMEFGNYFPICPLIFGQTKEDGAYQLTVRNDHQQAKWIVRTTLGDESQFQLVDFNAPASPPVERSG